MWVFDGFPKRFGCLERMGSTFGFPRKDPEKGGGVVASKRGISILGLFSGAGVLTGTLNKHIVNCMWRLAALDVKTCG